MDRLQETIADIAYYAGCMDYYTGDSRKDIADFIKWAKQFETLRRVDMQTGDETYNGKDYMTAIEEFAHAKTLSENPKEI